MPRRSSSFARSFTRPVLLASMAIAAYGCGGARDDASPDQGSLQGSMRTLGTNALAFGADTRAAIQRVREIEDHRLLNDAELRSYLQSTQASVAEAAAIAAGRIGDAAYAPDVLALLDATDARVRAAAGMALGLLEGVDRAAVEAALVAHLANEYDAKAKSQMLLTLGRKGTSASLPALADALTRVEDDDVQAAAAEALGVLVRSGVAFGTNEAVVARLLSFVSTYPFARATASGYALSGLSGQNVALPESTLLLAFAGSPSASARAFLARSLSVLGSQRAVEALAQGIANDEDAHARGDYCRFIARVGAKPAVLAALSEALRDRSPEVIVASATAIATLGPAGASLVPELAALYDASRSAWVKSTVLSTLVALDPESARSRVASGLTDSWPVRLAAIPALAVLGADEDIAQLVRIAGEADKRLAYVAIEAIATLPQSRSTPEMKERLRSVLANPDFETISAVADAVVALNWTDFADDFRALYDKFPGGANMNGRMAVLYALGTIGNTSDVPLFERGLLDDEQLVSQTAANAYKAITGVDVSDRTRKASIVRTATPSAFEMERAVSSFVYMETTRGPIVMRMLREAPLSATNFVRLARSGFYDGLVYHRVVPNFVAQGGDPRGDGFGGSNDLVREEISRVPHRRGTVGMATQGKDTASSQFFINHGWNVGLDGRYTVFAEVIFGMDAADRLEVGDTIVRTLVLPGLSLGQKISPIVK